MLAKIKVFQKIYICIMLTFIGLMGVVIFFAFSRTSGSTRQDMAEAHFVRQNAN
jgi:hypothetical protein